MTRTHVGKLCPGRVGQYTSYIEHYSSDETILNTQHSDGDNINENFQSSLYLIFIYQLFSSFVKDHIFKIMFPVYLAPPF